MGSVPISFSWWILPGLLGITAVIFGVVVILNRIKWPSGWFLLFGLFMTASAVGFYREHIAGP